MADEVIDISDDGSNDWMEKFSKEGEAIGWTINGEHVQRSKLRVDTRKWLLSKCLPKIYGERVSTELTGKDGGPIEIETVNHLALARWIAQQFALAMTEPKTIDAAG